MIWLVLRCLFDLHCTSLVLTENGIRCAAVDPHPACPADRRGWHVAVWGGAVCTRDCGPDDEDDTTMRRNGR